MEPLSQRAVNRKLASKLDFGQLSRLVKQVVSDTAGIALLSDEKKYIRSNCEKISLAIGSLGEDPYFAMGSIDCCHKFIFADQVLLEVPLTGNQSEPFALLYLYDYADTSGQGIENTEAVQVVADSVVREFNHLQEIEELSSELTCRHDELNLVMSIEDTNRDASDWQTTIKHQLSEFSETLEFGLSVILLNDYSLLPKVKTWDRGHSEETAIINALKEETLPWVQFNESAEVINSPTDPLRAEVCPSLPFKVMISPLLDNLHHTIGCIITLNSFYDRDFTQGDHKLQELVAKRVASEIDHHHDSLTKLLNRRGFQNYLEESLQLSVLHATEHTLLRIDVDRMRVTNDVAGYEQGDELLKMVAQSINRHVRIDDYVARTDGDVFHCILNQCPIDEGEGIATRILKEVRECGFQVAEKPQYTSVSIGVTSLSAVCQNTQCAVSAAKVACEAAKEAGQDRLRVFTQGNIDLLQREREFEWVNKIQKALQENRFTLFAQAFKSLQTEDAPPQFEILLRMIGEDGEIISPGEFMPVAERYQMMALIDGWAIRNGLHQIAKLNRELGYVDPIWNINVSGHAIDDEFFQQELLVALENSGVDPRTICLEIKETTAINHLSTARTFIESLKEKGVRLALDDFGTGVTSFSYLQSIDVDFLKIDGSFIRRICTDPVAETIVASIQQVAQSMGLTTIAEFVEDEETLIRLKEMGVDMGQGFAIHKPEPIETLLCSTSLESCAMNA